MSTQEIDIVLAATAVISTAAVALIFYALLLAIARDSHTLRSRILIGFATTLTLLVPHILLETVAAAIGGDGMERTFIHPGVPLKTVPLVIAGIVAWYLQSVRRRRYSAQR